MIEIKITYAKTVVFPSGPSSKTGSYVIEFETDDTDHAFELAERHFINNPPTAYVTGTMRTSLA